MKKHSLIALLLAGMMLLSACTGASEGGADTTAAPTNTTPTETEEEKLLPDLPEITFDGADYRIYSWNIDSWRIWDDIWVEDQNGEPINDAVYRRNAYIEETYEIEVVFSIDEYLDYEKTVATAVSASEDRWEAIISMGHDIPRLYASNVFYNLHNIPYLDFDKPWWDQNALENFTLAGYMPFTVSDMTILDKGVTAAVFFNKKLAEDYSLGNLYDHVYNDTWNLDTVITLGKSVSEDLNGDSVYDDEDRYGIVCRDDPVYMLFHSAGGRYITKDADGYPQLSFASERNYSVIQNYLENLMYDPLLTRNNDFVANGKSRFAMFMENQALFLFELLRGTNDLREMEADFGILPIPKYEVGQKDYASSVSVFGGNLISVPITCTQTEMTGIILEAMAAESSYTLIPAFYDTVLKDKSTRDVESTDMLDIIIDSMVFDVGDYYNLSNFPDHFLRITGNVYNSGNKSFPQRSSDIASFYAKYEKKLETALEDLIETIDEWNAME